MITMPGNKEIHTLIFTSMAVDHFAMQRMLNNAENQRVRILYTAQTN